MPFSPHHPLLSRESEAAFCSSPERWCPQPGGTDWLSSRLMELPEPTLAPLGTLPLFLHIPQAGFYGEPWGLKRISQLE